MHEAQLNAKLLAPLGIPDTFTLNELKSFYGLKVAPLPATKDIPLPADKFKLILHPKSAGSAREWPLQSYLELAKRLPPSQFHVYVSGLQTEADMIKEAVPELLTLPHVTLVAGKLTLPEFMGLIEATDGLLAASTGPLHVASALGKYALGLYPPIKPMHPGRWAPLGEHAGYLVKPGACRSCRYTPEDCACMRWIPVDAVYNTVLDWLEVPVEKR